MSEWLSMPMRWVRAHIEALPALVAERESSLTTSVAMGTGSVSKEDRRRIVAGWKRDAGVGEKRDGSKEVAGKAAMMGIGVRLAAKPR